jgi:hypothetical protein
VFALSEQSRSVLQEFLASADPRPVNAAVDPDGRCVLQRGAPQPPARPRLKIVE